MEASNLLTLLLTYYPLNILAPFLSSLSCFMNPPLYRPLRQYPRRLCSVGLESPRRKLLLHDSVWIWARPVAIWGQPPMLHHYNHFLANVLYPHIVSPCPTHQVKSQSWVNSSVVLLQNGFWVPSSLSKKKKRKEKFPQFYWFISLLIKYWN